MISFEWEDVISVLQNCAPYLIGLAVVLLIGIGVILAVRNQAQHKRFFIRAQAGIAMLLAILIAVNGIMLDSVSALMDLALTDSGDAVISDETMSAAKQTALEIAEEGFVLLQNDDDTLPLTDVTSLNLFGWASANPLYGGTGSGGINSLYDIVSIQQGLEDAGFAVNQDLMDFYTSYASERPSMTITTQEAFCQGKIHPICRDSNALYRKQIHRRIYAGGFAFDTSKITQYPVSHNNPNIRHS